MLNRGGAKVAFGLLVPATAAAGWLAVASYVSGLDAERALERGRTPSAAALALAADRRTGAAVSALADRDLEPDARLANYRTHLEAAERLFVAALRVCPAEARTRVHLAAVRYELDADEASLTRSAVLLAQAEALAPERADVQEALAELRLDTGERARGLEHLRRAIALDARRVEGAFRSLARRGYLPQEIAGLVPPEMRRHATLAQLYFEEGAELDYIALVEPLLASEPDPALVAHWAHAHRRASLWPQLEVSLTRMLEEDSRFERAQLRLERSRARMALGLAPAAQEDAEAAFQLDPASAVAAEQLGIAAFAAGEPERALVGFRAALERTVRGSADERVRARLYRGIGRSEQSLGRLDRARAAYRHALELDPQEPAATAQLQQIDLY